MERSKMKYHGAIIKKVPTDLGEADTKLNFTYEVYKDGEWKGVCLVLDEAKEFVDSGFDERTYW